MRLTSFRVTNYRSVSDSGSVDVADRTALVGRNESGKTNLLLALQDLNPPGGRAPLVWVKDFPRNRPRSEFHESLPVVSTVWELSEAERAELSSTFPRASTVCRVRVVRKYDTALLVSFEDLAPVSVPTAEVADQLRSLKASAQASARTSSDRSQQMTAELATLDAALEPGGAETAAWAQKAVAGVTAFEAAVSAQQMALAEKANAALASIRRIAAELAGDEQAAERARNWVVQHLPVIIYVADYPELAGHQHIADFLERRKAHDLEDADRNFEKLMKVAELNPEELHSLLTTNPEERQQLTNRAGALVTAAVRRLWTDRQLTVRFNIDAEHFDTLVSDPNAVYPMEVNLDERSRGFRWFFSFYVTFAADTAGGPAAEALLLLDEPGLHLHATAQRDLLRQFATDFGNQIIYTTHSPFMVPVDDIASVRTVNISADTGTTVANDPTGDSKTLFPLQAALGFEIAQTLFVGPSNLVVEGVTDFWYLSAVNDILADRAKTPLGREVAITPAGGASKVTYLVSLLSSQNLDVVVLLDDEPSGRQQALELARSKLIRDDYIIFASGGFEESPSGGCDIEDLLDPSVFDTLCRESYASELAGRALSPRPEIGRVVRRYEQAFSELGIEFNKTRPAKLFLRRIATAPDEVLPAESVERFERLLRRINAGFTALARRDAPPFR